MRYLLLVILSVGLGATLNGQDVTVRPIVYQESAMSKVIVKQNIEYRNINDTSLKLDIYYPPGFTYNKKLPVVIFNNGVGSMDLPQWRVYKDWARLMAAHGMIAINHQTRPGRTTTLSDCEALVDYLVQHAASLSLDADRIGMWTCSANTRTGARVAFKTRPDHIKALVMYYGTTDSLGQLRQDLPTLVVRAALDAQFLNMGIDNFVQSALQQDARVELYNYLNGIHAFDIFTNTPESKEIIKRTVQFFSDHLNKPVTQKEFVLTNRNFMWLIVNNQLPMALSEFRKARDRYRADSTFQPFFNGVIREDVLNANAYFLMNNQRQQEGIELFKLMVETYPESANAYDGLSEAYELTGNKEEAIRNANFCLQKLDKATDINEDFKNRIRKASAERIQRLH
jgi:tetratricopeptide (TPR) repeat protein